MSTALALREGVQRLEITMRVTVGVLALASGVYTYLGVRELLSGSPTLVFFAALIYSVAVSVGIYAFWSFLLRLAPHVRDQVGRGLLFAAMALGSLMIVAMSAWLNATALAGAAALEQHLATTLQSYSRDLDRAHRQALAAQGLLPDIQMASTQFSRLAEAERSGSLTGTSGSGTVVQLLSQMGTQLGGLAKEVTDGSERVKTLNEQGGKHLAKMREIVSSRGPILPRSDAFASEATALQGVIASLQQTSVAPAVKRAADNLSKTFIAPAAGGRFGDLAERQTAVVGRVQEAVTAQAKTLSDAADQIISQPPVEPTRFRAMSTAEAVLRYASEFLPSWAGAISIDLLPAVLVLILCIVHAAIRREGMPEATAGSMTASDLMTALRLAREVEEAKTAPRPAAISETALRQEPDSLQPEPPKTEGIEQPSRPDWKPEENVTPLSSARAGKKD
jgi:uncharacterized membrane protein YedE/YeeE